MYQYDVADIILNVTSNNSYLVERFESFLSHKQSSPDVSIDMKKSSQIKMPDGEMILDEKIKWAKKYSEKEGYYIYSLIEPEDKISVIVDVENNWDYATLTYSDNPYNMDKEIFYSQIEAYAFFLVSVIFRNCILNHQGFIIHGSAIDFKGNGIIFSAPSGTGKSTHVQLWEKFWGKEIKVLNDDTPAIRFRGECPFVFGTPWSGSSNKYSNSAAPLKAIVVLEQASENSISRLSNQEAVLRLMPRVFLPFYCNSMMGIAIKTFENVISMTPTYLLKCRPDQEAVEMVYKCVI